MGTQGFALRGSAALEHATGHLRPDGAAIVAVLRGAVLTDQGETARWMCRRIGAARLPLRALRTVEGICRMNDAEIERGAVLVRLADLEEGSLREGADRLGRICARIARLKIGT